MVKYEKLNLGGQEFLVKTKIRQSDLTPECWSIQVWGLPYCSGLGNYQQMCKYLASEECGGQRIRKKILRGKYPVNGLPDFGVDNEESK